MFRDLKNQLPVTITTHPTNHPPLTNNLILSVDIGSEPPLVGYRPEKAGTNPPLIPTLKVGMKPLGAADFGSARSLARPIPISCRDRARVIPSGYRSVKCRPDAIPVWNWHSTFVFFPAHNANGKQIPISMGPRPSYEHQLWTEVQSHLINGFGIVYLT